MRVVGDGVGRRPVRLSDGLERRQLPLRGDRELGLRATVRVMHQLVRGVGLVTCLGRVRLPVRGMQISVSFRRPRMADGLVERSPARDHRLYDQAQHQKRPKELAAQGADPAGITLLPNAE